MTLDEIVNEITKYEDDKMARVFTMTIANLLIANGIQPIVQKSIADWDEKDDVNRYIMRRTYNATFDIDTSVHDAKVRADAIEKFAHSLKETFNNEFPSNYHCTQPYFTLDNVRVLVDAVAKEQNNV